jgi:dUTP pyrophosphatase
VNLLLTPPPLRFTLLSHAAGLPAPRYATAGAAAVDLYAAEGGALGFESFGSPFPVKTGLCVAIPQGWVGRVASRSGLFFRDGVEAFPGVIDSDYRGEIIVGLVLAASKAEFRWQRGHRIAQLLIQPAPQVAWEELPPAEFADLATERGAGGFGSTGRN